MQYRMRGVTYQLPTDLNDTNTSELDRVQWLARKASFNLALQQAARDLLKKGTHIHMSDRSEYIVCDSFYNIQHIDEYYHDLAMDQASPVSEEYEVERQEQEEAVASPTVAVNIQGKCYWLAYGGVSSITAWEQYRREHRARKSLPTTEEVMLWDLRECGAKK